jgi:hypothetical protein
MPDTHDSATATQNGQSSMSLFLYIGAACAGTSPFFYFFFLVIRAKNYWACLALEARQPLCCSESTETREPSGALRARRSPCYSESWRAPARPTPDSLRAGAIEAPERAKAASGAKGRAGSSGDRWFPVFFFFRTTDRIWLKKHKSETIGKTRNTADGRLI